MNDINLILLGTLTIFAGCILITRKKIVIKGEYEYLYAALVIMVPFIRIMTVLITDERIYVVQIILYSLFIIVPLLLFILYSFNKEKSKYYVHNTNISMIMPIIINFLDQNDISYEEREKTIFLKDYDGFIYYKSPLDLVILDFKEIKNTSFPVGLIEELKIKTKDIQAKVFPISGVIFIGMGILLFLTKIYI